MTVLKKKTWLEDHFLFIDIPFDTLRKPISALHKAARVQLQLNVGFQIIACIHENSCSDYPASGEKLMLLQTLRSIKMT